MARKAGHYANALPGRVLLGALIRDGVEPPEYVMQDLLLQGRVHAISAPPGSGKSLIAVGSGLRVIEAGRSVVYVDGENGPEVMARRLESLGAEPDLLDASFYYYPILLGKNDAQRLRKEVEELRPALVVFDSLADFLTAAGAEENSNSDFGSWFAEFITPLKRQGVAVLVLDHVPKSVEGTARGPRGAGAKSAKVDVQWSLKVVRQFGRKQVGEVELTCSKDREGLVPRTVSFTIGGGVFKRKAHSSPDNQPKLTTNEQRLLERTLRAGEDGVRRKDLEAELNGNKGSASRALEALERYHLIEKYGVGRSTRYVAVRAVESETGVVPKKTAATPIFDGTTRYQKGTTVPSGTRESGKSTNGTSTKGTGTVGTHPPSDTQEQPENCIHDYPGGVGCYLCDPDHPYRRDQGDPRT